MKQLSLNYQIYYRAAGETADSRLALMASDPIAALNAFHSRIQHGEATNKACGPADYTITRLVQTYPSLDKNLKTDYRNMIEAEIDLPKTPNPAIKAPAAPQVATQDTFPFAQ